MTGADLRVVGAEVEGAVAAGTAAEVPNGTVEFVVQMDGAGAHGDDGVVAGANAESGADCGAGADVGADGGGGGGDLGVDYAGEGLHGGETGYEQAFGPLAYHPDSCYHLGLAS